MSPRALCEIASPPGSSFSRRKNTSYAEVQHAEVPWISIYNLPTPPFLRSTRAEGTKHERFGTSLEKLARDKTSVLAAKLRLFCIVSLLSTLFHPSSLFRIYRLRELSESRDTNLTCTTTNEARRKGFERLRAWKMPSRLQSKITPQCIHMYFAFWIRTRKYIECLEIGCN